VRLSPRGAKVAGAGPEDGRAAATDGLIRALDANRRFRRDGRIAGIFHPGTTSFRELSPTDSLHIVIHGTSVSAHVDEICPLRSRPGGTGRYSWALVLAHNISGAAADLGRRLRGHHGKQRCNLGCEVRWVDEEQISEQVAVRSEAGDPARRP